MVWISIFCILPCKISWDWTRFQNDQTSEKGLYPCCSCWSCWSCVLQLLFHCMRKRKGIQTMTGGSWDDHQCGKAGFSPYTSQTELHKMSTTNLYLGRSWFRPATKMYNYTESSQNNWRTMTSRHLLTLHDSCAGCSWNMLRLECTEIRLSHPGLHLTLAPS